MSSKPQTKKFQGGERTVPHHLEKASKYYPAEEDRKPKTARKTIRPHKPRDSLKEGQIVIILAGRFRGKRVVLLRHLGQGVLLVTGPFKVNGVPLRRVNSRFVMATSTKVDLKGVDEKVLKKLSDPKYFARAAKDKKKGEEAFFKQGEKPEKKTVDKSRVEDQKAVDKALVAAIKKTEMLESYLRTSFSLRHGQRPHEMVF